VNGLVDRPLLDTRYATVTAVAAVSLLVATSSVIAQAPRTSDLPYSGPSGAVTAPERWTRLPARINRAGRGLSASRKRVLERAKGELRKAFGRRSRAGGSRARR